MNKCIYFAFILVFVSFVSVSCEKDDNDCGVNGTACTSIDQKAIIPDLNIIAEEINWVSIHGLEQSFISQYIFRSKDDINNFFVLLEELISEWVFPFIEPHFEIYDDAFFESNVLVMLNLTVTSSPIRQLIDSISVNENELNVKIKSIPLRQDQNCVMVYSHAFIPIKMNHFLGDLVNIDIIGFPMCCVQFIWNEKELH